MSYYLNGVIRHPTAVVDGAMPASWAKPRNVNFFIEEIQLHELRQTPRPPPYCLKYVLLDIIHLHRLKNTNKSNPIRTLTNMNIT
jgi:hypothetical protein